MKVHAQTPEGWIWIEMPDPIPPPPKTDMELIQEDIAAIKKKLGA